MGKSSNGPSPQVQEGMLQNQTALTNIAQQQETNAQQLYGITEPGLVASEDFYEKLASGDPGAIMQAIAPAAEQTSQAAAGARSNIMSQTPAGGEKNLALEQTFINQGSQVAQAASGATLGAPNALGQLAGQGVGESISAANTGVSGLSAANSGLASLGQLQIQGQQVTAQEKGQTLGALGSLAGGGAAVGAAAM
jgi:hypothetical protein